MSDLITRLKTERIVYDMAGEDCAPSTALDLCDEAADEIERLEAKVEKLESIISRAHAEIEMLIEGMELRQ